MVDGGEKPKAQEKPKKEEKKPEKKENPKTVTRNELKAMVLLGGAAVAQKDNKIFTRVLRLSRAVQKNLTPAILSDAIDRYYPQLAPSIEQDRELIASEREADVKEALEEKNAAEAAAQKALQAEKEKKEKEKSSKPDDKIEEKKTKEQIKEQEKKDKEEADKAAKEAEKKKLRLKEEAKKEEEAKQLPEVKALIHLLVCTYLTSRGRREQAAESATALVTYIHSFNRRSLDLISTRAYEVYSLTYEHLGQLESIRSNLLAYQRTACLQHNEPGQATLIVAILRNFLHYRLYSQADQFRSSANFPESRSNNTLARYLYYIGRINAVQLQYSEAFNNLTQALRKAPQNIALGFRQTVSKLLVIVQLLMGEIPERSVFRQVGFQAALHPYFQLTQAVRVGDLTAFEKVVQEFGPVWIKDDTSSLIVRVRNNVIKTGLRKINASYSRISLQDVCTKLNLPCVEDAEFIVAKGIRDGVIEAVIDREKGYVAAKETVDVYSTYEPGAQYHKRVMFCMDIHNGAVKALRFPGNSHKEVDEDETQRDDDEVLLEVDTMEDD